MTPHDSRPGRVLIAVAAPAEARAVRIAVGLDSTGPGGRPWALEQGGRGFDLIETGVGKAQAAAGVIWAFDRDRHAGVLNIGVAGVLPGNNVSLGDTVLASRSLFGDEGLDTPDGFVAIESLGFDAGLIGPDDMAPPSAWLDALAPLTDTVGTIVTVSTCSSRDGRAAELARRTGAIAEAMEGAAIAAGLCRLAGKTPAFAEVRVISNTTGDRSGQQWDLDQALAGLRDFTLNLDGERLAAQIAPD